MIIIVIKNPTRTWRAAVAGTPDRRSPRAPGRRATSRRLVLDELVASDQFRTVLEIHDALARRGAGVGLTSVYRATRDLHRAGVVEVVTLADGRAGFRGAAPSGSPLYLVCVRCGRAVGASRGVVDAWAQEAGRAQRFSDVEVRVSLHGVCATCGPGGVGDRSGVLDARG
ncbi:Fur family transcriptional regulator [Cellulosimicrobium cellulans]|uniref:Fur family transcriptional regulator n=1 Tax=Cellulosimicrobium cellulans TaxID=1710 RepID=UPI0025B79888|nr:transcriptional repressor [Cellulosimicrobium cellulans]